MLFVVLRVVRCLLCVVVGCCSVSVVRCLLMCVVGCLLLVVCLSVLWCLFFVVYSVLVDHRSLCGVICELFVVMCSLFFVMC